MDVEELARLENPENASDGKIRVKMPNKKVNEMFALASQILGGRRVKVVATTVYDEFMNTLNWPLGAAIAVTLLVAVMIIMITWNRLVERRYGEALQ